MVGELETYKRSPLHKAECLRIVDEIIDCLDERGINEIMEGTDKDIDYLIEAMLEETFSVIYTGNREIDFAPHYTERLSEGIEEILRVNNLTYFITSVLPDFQLNNHHVEWSDLVMHYNKLCVEAARGHGKCLGVGTMVRMYNGELKKVEDLSVGDSLMGIDSKPRVITALHKGTDKHMYKFHQSRGDDFVVNSKHTQTFIHVSKRGGFLENREKHIVDIDMQDFLSMTPNTIKETIRTFKVACDYPERKVLVDPYYLGIWLGDGYSHSTTICKPYKEIIEFCDWYANKLNIFCDHDNWNENLKCYSNHIFYEKKDWCEKKKRNIKRSKLFKFMKAYHLFNNKHIPDAYLHNSKRIRMRLLAGLIDSDGDYWEHGYHYNSINKHLVEQIKDLADSLGFRTSKVLGGVAYNKQLKRDYESYSVTISGKIDEIPVRIKHKQMSYDWFSKTSYKDWGVVDGITPTVVSSVKVEDIGPGEYVCITTDGDKRFLLADGTVTHNSYFFSNAYIIWQLYRYKRPKTMQFSMRPTTSSSNRGFLFSFSLQQAVDLIEILKGTIENNDILSERLMPSNTKEGAWASTNITCRNGARLTGKGFGSSVRGAHPFFIVVDDGLKDNVIYSSLQRQKSIDYFHSVIMNMIIPGGQTIVVGCVSPNTIVLSDKRGFIRMHDVKHNYMEDRKKVTHHVEGFLDKNGFSKTSHYFYNGIGDMLRITLQGGFELECSKIHPLWKMFENGIPGWQKSSDLNIGDYIAIKPTNIESFGEPVELKPFISSYKRKNKRNYNEINLKLPLYLDEDLAYFIGLWIAEGTIYKNGSGIEMSTGDYEIECFLKSLIKYNINFRGNGIDDKSYAYCCTNKRLHNFFTWLGFDCPCYCNIKNIPNKLLSAPKSILRHIISGIFDGDGSVYETDDRIEVSLYSTSPGLIKTMQSILLMGWGIVSTYDCIKAESINASGKNDTHVNYDQYSLGITGYNAVKFGMEIGFRLSRKQLRIEKHFSDKFNFNFSKFYNIPHQGVLYKNAEDKRLANKITYRDKDGFGKFIENAYQIKKSKTINKFALKRVCEFMKRITNSNDYDQLIRNCEEDVIWRKIIKIEKINGSSCDFIIPKTHSFITNGIVSHNTPFHAQDLYGDLKTKKGWFVIEYPAIFPDGRILWPSRFSYQNLMEMRITQGNIIFSRENLCRPIVSDASIFSLDVLRQSLIRMDNYCLVRNRDDFPKKFDKVVVGADFAISSAVGADFYCYTVFGVGEDGGMWLLWIEIGKGKKYDEQLQILRGINARFRPDVMVFESNVFQQIFTDTGQDYGMPVVSHSTGVEKNDLAKGWCALAIMFERGLFHIPTGDDFSVRMKDMIFDQLGSVAFTDQGLQSVGSHDDICSSMWLATLGRNLSVTGSKFMFL